MKANAEVQKSGDRKLRMGVGKLAELAAALDGLVLKISAGLCCSVLQCVAVCCSVLRWAAVQEN